MSDSIQAAVIDEITERVTQILPSTMPFFNAQKAQRINWRVLVEQAQKGRSGGLTAPWGVIWFGPTSEIDCGMTNEVSSMPVQVWFVEELRNDSGVAVQTTVLNKALADQINDFWLGIRDHSYSYFNVPMQSPRRNISETSEVNDFFLKSNLPFKASEISFTVNFGEYLGA